MGSVGRPGSQVRGSWQELRPKEMWLCSKVDWPVKTALRATTAPVPGLCPVPPCRALPQKGSVTPTSLVAGINVTPILHLVTQLTDKSRDMIQTQIHGTPKQGLPAKLPRPK